ncbi:MAG: protein kinase [Actinomycetota bacterium]|nr:protein kinase [Actinomycetota bacterium]
MPQELVVVAERYALEERVAEGGMAAVWRARDDVLARTVAVKILHPHLAEDASFLERFRREALAAARLTHPNVVAIFDTGTEDTTSPPRHFIVMEYCAGGTLASVLAREGPLDHNRVINVGAAVCSALDYAHRNEVIHRDLKPANVLISDDGTLKVADFGIAKAAFVGREITTTGSLIGTVTYISPEQARGDEPDARSDLYSLGAVLYELLVGRPPFVGETALATAMKHLQEDPPAPRSIRAGVPRSLEAIVLKTLAKDPDDRFTSADELRTELLRSGGGNEGTLVMRAPRDQRSGREPPLAETHGDARWIARVLFLVASVVLVALAVAWLIDQDDVAPQRDGGAGGAGARRISTATDFDPFGSGGEHPEEVGFAFDGRPATAWSTEGYDSPLHEQKEGVGLIFDLGRTVEVATVEVVATEDVTFELRAADELGDGTTHETFEEVADGVTESGATSLDVGSEPARFWLVWITRLPGEGSGEASVFEVTFFGP